MLNRGDPLPLYHQLKSVLAHRIVVGQYPLAEPLPSERLLMGEFRVSRITVRLALQELVREGLLRRERGRGSFVIASKLSRQGDRLASLDEDELAIRAPLVVKEAGVRPLGPRDKIPECFMLGPEDALYRVDRLAVLGDKPLIHSSIYIRLPADASLTIQTLDEFKSIYTLLERHFGIKIDHGSRTVEAVGARRTDSRRLGVPPGSPLLLVRTTTVDSVGRALTYAESWYRGDRWQYVIPHVEREGAEAKARLVTVSL